MAGTLLDNLRTYLVAQGIVRIPRNAGPLPPLWLEPRKGVPAPGEKPADDPDEIGPDIVLGAYLNPAGGIPAQPFESAWRTDIVEIRYRARNTPFVVSVEKQIRSALIDQRNWDCGPERIIDTEEWRALSRLASDEQAFDYSSAYVFYRYA